MVKFNKTRIAAAAGALFAAFPHAYAQSTPESAGESLTETASDDSVEEIVVVGVRGSLQRAMDVKRNAVGVVDAISAEDMGKFPDTNLAESLQRITGVSIDRRDGEGSQVTVRGFGGGNNLVTLNGRQMPAADVNLGEFSEGTSRSFNFANLASEAVSGIEVYKTGRASIPTGGIGATINIKTRRPLDSPGLKASLGAKAVNDTSTITGDDITPELSGLFSWTNDDETFGVALTGSFQERNGGAISATVNDWRTYEMGDSVPNIATGAIITNPPSAGQLVSLPNDIRYHFEEIQRERTNAQLTLQFRPMDTLTLTGDYTYAENDLQQQRGDQTLWFNQAFNEIDFDGSPIVAAPLRLYEDITNVKDHGFEQQSRHIVNTLNSVGFNADWQATDQLRLAFDGHVSSMESLPGGPAGTSSVTFSMAGPVIAAQEVFYNSGLPIQNQTIDDSRGNANGVFDVGDLGTQVQRLFTSSQTSDVTQLRLDGSWEFDDGRFDFGVETKSVEMQQKFKQNQQVLGDWGVNNPGEIPADLIDQFCLTCMFEDHNAVSPTNQVAFRGDAVALAQWAAGEYGLPFSTLVENGYDQHHRIEEDSHAAYIQATLQGEMAGMPTNIVFGLRYETTDVTSTSFTTVPAYFLWQDNNDFLPVLGDDTEVIVKKASYDNLLPSIDFDIEFAPDVKGRASFSQTIARAGYLDLRAADNATTPSGPTYLGNIADATGGNPGLVPLQSDNYDFSVEWYYGESSYASLGYYEKRVRNFIGTQTFDEPLYGLRDPTSGAAGSRSGDAVIALQERGYDVNETNLFVMTAVLDNPDDFPNGADDFDPNGEYNGQPFVDGVAAAYDIIADANDPEFLFRVARQVNNREANINGFEFAIQHFFGETGVGFQANYTTVNGDVGFDTAGSLDADQFALTGLSDTANLSLIYENFGLSARLAYNWRDEFLNNTNFGSYRNPEFTEEYEQWDINISYNVSDHIDISFEGINLTEENVRRHARTTNQMTYLQELKARYLLGIRYTF